MRRRAGRAVHPPHRPAGGAGVLALVLPLTIWVSGASFAVAIVGVFVYRVLALLLPMPVSLAALPTPRKLAEGQDKPTGAPHEPALRSPGAASDPSVARR